VAPHHLQSCCHCQVHDGRNLADACTAGLYLPTSDIDLVVMDSGADDVKIALKALGNKLGNTGIATKIQVGPQTCLMTSELRLQTLPDTIPLGQHICIYENGYKRDAAPHLKTHAYRVDKCLRIPHHTGSCHAQDLTLTSTQMVSCSLPASCI